MLINDVFAKFAYLIIIDKYKARKPRVILCTHTHILFIKFTVCKKSVAMDDLLDFSEHDYDYT